jgi:hypothetical protein
VDADDEEGFVGAEVVEGVEGYASRAGFGGDEQFGFVLIEIGGGVDDGVGRLGEQWGCCECEGEEEARGMLAPLGTANCNGWFGWSRR